MVLTHFLCGSLDATPSALKPLVRCDPSVAVPALARNVNAGLIDETALRYGARYPEGIESLSPGLDRAARDYPGNVVPEFSSTLKALNRITAACGHGIDIFPLAIARRLKCATFGPWLATCALARRVVWTRDSLRIGIHQNCPPPGGCAGMPSILTKMISGDLIQRLQR
jgi:hypothetical protein